MSEPKPRRLRSKAAAEFIGVSPSTLSKWRKQKFGPPFHRLTDRIIYYLEDELRAWIEQCDREAG